MRIKTLNELSTQFETISPVDQRQISGGYYQVNTLAGPLLNLTDIIWGWNFASDNDPNTFGGGSFNYVDANNNTQVRDYEGLEFDGSIQLIGNLFGYGEVPMPVYYDTLLGGYILGAGYGTSHLILAETDSETFGIAQGDYQITYTTSALQYFDDLAGGYLTTYKVEADVVYTGYETLSAQIIAQREADEAARAKAEYESSVKMATEQLNTYLSMYGHQAVMARILSKLETVSQEAVNNAAQYNISKAEGQWRFFQDIFKYTSNAPGMLVPWLLSLNFED